jgi:hypothetical protein
VGKVIGRRVLIEFLEEEWSLFGSLAIDLAISNANNLLGELWGALLQELLKGPRADH